MSGVVYIFGLCHTYRLFFFWVAKCGIGAERLKFSNDTPTTRSSIAWGHFQQVWPNPICARILHQRSSRPSPPHNISPMDTKIWVRQAFSHTTHTSPWAVGRDFSPLSLITWRHSSFRSNLFKLYCARHPKVMDQLLTRRWVGHRSRSRSICESVAFPILPISAIWLADDLRPWLPHSNRLMHVHRND